MKYGLILMLLLVGLGNLQAKDNVSPATIDSSGVLSIVDIKVFVQPCDTIIYDSSGVAAGDTVAVCHFTDSCMAAMRCSNPDSALCAVFTQPGSCAEIILVIEVADPTIVDRLYLKGSNSSGGNNLINRNIPFQTAYHSQGNLKATMVNDQVIEIRLRRRNQSIPFYLEAWLTDTGGNSSPVFTINKLPY